MELRSLTSSRVWTRQEALKILAHYRNSKDQVGGYISLATLFNIEIRVLPDRSLMEIGENVNAGAQEQQFSKISFENRKNTQSQMVACDSRYVDSRLIRSNH